MQKVNSPCLPRDKSRRPESKRAALSRRAARRAKSARLFLACAFPAELAF